MDLAQSIEQTKLRNTLNWYEDQIRTRAKSLAAIFVQLRNDPQKPWRVSHESYEAYCLEVWNMSPRRIQQIAAGETVKALLAAEAPELAETVKKMPEGQIRALATAPPEKRAEVLRSAVEKPGKMTARKIKAAKARVIDHEEEALESALASESLATPAPTASTISNGELPPAAKVCPHCGKEIE